MQCSHCRWLNWGHSFLLSKCALGKPLVHLLMCHFGDIILCRWIGDTVCYCGRAEVRVPAIAWHRKCVCRTCANRRQVARVASSVLSIIHYLRMHSFKNDWENWSGQNRTSRTACYDHATFVHSESDTLSSGLNTICSTCVQLSDHDMNNSIWCDEVTKSHNSQ